MPRRFPSSLGLVGVVVALSIGPVLVQGQGKAAAKAAWKTPRTPDGQPDLQGTWSFATLTPLERPSDLAGKDVFTDEEAAEFEQQTIARTDADRRDRAGTDADVGLAYNQFWYDRGTKVIATKRTSLIVDPPDGRIPPLTPAAQARSGARAEARRLNRGPEDRSVGERCIMGFNAGPPMVPGGYNQNVQILQTHDYVVILNEMVHSARVVPIDGRPHGSVRQWAGDSRGRWDGNTLIVDTTNFYQETSLRDSTANMHLVERFTRVDLDTLLYEFAVDDATTWTRPWTAQIPMARTEEPIYEYACHEGNYSMSGILAGARAEEKSADRARTKRD